MTSTDARPFVPAMQARRWVLDGLTDWADFTPDRAAIWEAPYGPAESWDLRIDDDSVEGPHGPIPIRIYRPTDNASSRRPGLVWCHGGGFVGGDLDMPEGHEVARGLAGRAGAVVVSVDYRLCPLPPGMSMGSVTPSSGAEVRFPVPHDDVLAAFRWTRTHAVDLGLDPDRLALGGASAGANLAAGVTLRLRDDGEIPHQLLLAYPVLHPTMPAPSPELAEAIAVTPPLLRFPPELCTAMSENYLGGSTEGAPPYAFAGLSTDLTGFPPTLIDNDEFDDLRCSGEAFARQLRDAGVDVEQVTTQGVPHGHLNRVGFDPTHASLDRMAARLASQVG